MSLISRLTFPLFLLLLFSLFPLSVSATTTETPEAIAARLQERYDKMTSLSFTFKQQSHGQVSGRPRTGGGKALFYKTGKNSRMRWDYTEPDRQVLISDGTTFSMYFEALNQMIVTPAESLESDLTYTFFSGKGKIAELFHILPSDFESGEETENPASPKVIKLVPKEEQSQVQTIHLWVDADSLIRRIELRDYFDTVTLLNLSSIAVDDLTASQKDIGALFLFVPPEGTEIINQ